MPGTCRQQLLRQAACGSKTWQSPLPPQVSCILVHRCWSKFFGLLAFIVGMLLLGGCLHFLSEDPSASACVCDPTRTGNIRCMSIQREWGK